MRPEPEEATPPAAEEAEPAPPAVDEGIEPGQAPAAAVAAAAGEGWEPATPAPASDVPGGAEPSDQEWSSATATTAAIPEAPGAEEESEQKWVWGDSAEGAAAGSAAALAASETTELQPQAAPIEPGDEIVETRRYPPRDEVRREELDDYRRQQAAETSELQPAYYEEEAGLGIRPGILMATIGFAVALAGVFFPWVSIEGTDIKALDDSTTATIAGQEVEGTFEFQVQDLLDSPERLDAYLVIGLCAVGIFFLLIEYVLLRRFPIGRVYAALGGLAVGALGVVELLYIRDVVPDDVSFSYEPGLFMVTIGGAAAIVGSLIPVGSGED